MSYDKLERAAEDEQFDHTMTCPECKRENVHTLPAEGITDQLLRGCPFCGAVFYQRD